MADWELKYAVESGYIKYNQQMHIPHEVWFNDHTKNPITKTAAAASEKCCMKNVAREIATTTTAAATGTAKYATWLNKKILLFV